MASSVLLGVSKSYQLLRFDYRSISSLLYVQDVYFVIARELMLNVLNSLRLSANGMSQAESAIHPR